jgi:hypothetical protein
MSAAEAAGVVAVLPGMIEVEAGVVVAVIMPDPFAVVVDVRSFGVAWMVDAGCGSGGRSVDNRLGTVLGNVSAADGMSAAAVVLGQGGKRKKK